MKKSVLLFLLVGLHLFFLINLQFTVWPEMISYPYLVNNGFKLYSDFIHPYPPLLTATLALVFKVFGAKLIVLKIFTWLLLVLNDILIYLILNKLTRNNSAALASVVLYVLVQPFLEGNMLWFDLAIVTPILAGIYFLLADKTIKNTILAGLFFTLAVFIKQTTVLCVIVAILYIIYRDRKLKSLAHFLAPGLILGLGFLAWLFTTNQFLDFLNWNLVYPFTFWSKYPDYVQMNLDTGQRRILMTLLGPILLLTLRKISILKDTKFALLFSFLLVSFIMVYPRFSFFHFQLAIALIAIIFGYLLSFYNKKLSQLRIFLFVGLAVGIVIVRPIVSVNWQKEARFWGKTDINLAQKLKGKSLYLLGPHSGLYAYSNSLPSKPWTDNFGWYLEIPGMQEKIISKWGENPPDYIYWQTPQQGNWYNLASYQPKEIIDWIVENYTFNEKVSDNVSEWIKKD